MRGGLNRQDRLAVLALGLIITGFSFASYWLSRQAPSSPFTEMTLDTLASTLETEHHSYHPRKYADAEISHSNLRQDQRGTKRFQKNEAPYSNSANEIPLKKYTRNSPFQKSSAHNEKLNSKYWDFSYSNNQVARIIDLNEADSSALIPLPCIGPALAARIIKYRNKLGGFYNVEQLKETYGITDSIFQILADKITIKQHSWKLIFINKISLEELKLHPYFRWDIANQIINYRNAHGPFFNIEDLKKILTINDEILTRITPYLEFE